MKKVFLRRSNIANNKVLRYQAQKPDVELIPIEDMFVTCSEENIFEKIKNELKKHSLNFDDFCNALSQIGILLPVHIKAASSRNDEWWRILYEDEIIFRLKLGIDTEYMTIHIRQDAMPVITENTYIIYPDTNETINVSMVETNVRIFDEGIVFRGKYLKESDKYCITRCLDIPDEIGAKLILKISSQNPNLLSKNIEIVDDYFMNLYRNCDFESEINHILFLMGVSSNDLNEIEISFELQKEKYREENEIFRNLISSGNKTDITYYENGKVSKQIDVNLEPQQKQVHYDNEYEVDSKELEAYIRRVSKTIGIHPKDFGQVLKGMEIELPVKLSKYMGYRFLVEDKYGEKVGFEFYSKYQMYLVKGKERKTYRILDKNSEKDEIKVWCSAYEVFCKDEVKWEVKYEYPNNAIWALTQDKEMLRKFCIKNAPRLLENNQEINEIFFNLGDSTDAKLMFFKLISEMEITAEDIFETSEISYEDSDECIKIMQVSARKNLVAKFTKGAIKCDSIFDSKELNEILEFIRRLDDDIDLEICKGKMTLKLPDEQEIILVISENKKNDSKRYKIYKIFEEIYKSDEPINVAKYFYEVVDTLEMTTEDIWLSEEVSICNQKNEVIKYKYEDGYRKLLVKLEKIEESKYTIVPLPNMKYFENALFNAREGLLKKKGRR